MLLRIPYYCGTTSNKYMPNNEKIIHDEYKTYIPLHISAVRLSIEAKH
jgi:hypothetical protein